MFTVNNAQYRGNSTRYIVNYSYVVNSTHDGVNSHTGRMQQTV